MQHIFATTPCRIIIAAALFVAAAIITTPVASASETLLTWTAPTLNDDGSPLTDLDHYEIYYGCANSGNYPISTSVPATQTSLLVEDLPENATCFFAATAVNTSGVESIFSDEATKVFGDGGVLPLPDPVENLVVTAQESPPFIYTLPATQFDGTPVVAGTFNAAPDALNIEFTIAPNSFPDAWPRIISKANGTSSQDHVFMVSINYGKLRFRLKVDGTTHTLVGNANVPLGQTTVGRASFDGTNMRLHFNGALDAEATHPGNIDQTSDAVWVGGNPPNNASPFDGEIAVTVK